MNLVQERFYPEKSLTNVVIDAAHEVFRQLGKGFLEKVYENSLHVELLARGVSLMVERRLLVELERSRRADL